MTTSISEPLVGMPHSKSKLSMLLKFQTASLTLQQGYKDSSIQDITDASVTHQYLAQDGLKSLLSNVAIFPNML